MPFESLESFLALVHRQLLRTAELNTALLSARVAAQWPVPWALPEIVGWRQFNGRLSILETSVDYRLLDTVKSTPPICGRTTKLGFGASKFGAPVISRIGSLFG